MRLPLRSYIEKKVLSIMRLVICDKQLLCDTDAQTFLIIIEAF